MKSHHGQEKIGSGWRQLARHLELRQAQLVQPAGALLLSYLRFELDQSPGGSFDPFRGENL
jgi:hypothetical protein